MNIIIDDVNKQCNKTNITKRAFKITNEITISNNENTTTFINLSQSNITQSNNFKIILISKEIQRWTIES